MGRQRSGALAVAALSADVDLAGLMAAGAIAEIARVGYAPFEDDDPIEITFASGAVFHVDIGFEGATDVVIRRGPLIEHAYAHLRTEEPETFAAIARDWTREALDLDWAAGHAFTNPRRLAMTQPYRVDVGYAFDVGGRVLALFGEADLIFAAALDDIDIAAYGLEIGAPPE